MQSEAGVTGGTDSLVPRASPGSLIGFGGVGDGVFAHRKRAKCNGGRSPADGGNMSIADLELSAPCEQARRRRWGRVRRLWPAWDDAPLRLKLVVLISLGVAGGVALAVVEIKLGHQVWPLMLGLTVVLGGLWSLAQVWVSGPLEHLLNRLERVARGEQSRTLRRLPISRRDEVGRIARAVHRLAVERVRSEHEASNLRRTLDHRIARATQVATKQLRRLALRDPLTDLGNRRFLDEHLEAVVRLVRSAEEDLVCVLIDIDHFKEINDACGHAAGDELLIMLALLVRGSIRRSDLAARLGGDEFVLFLPATTPERAAAVAENVRLQFCQQAKAIRPSEPRVNLSIGIASLVGDHCEDGKSLLLKADQRLYEAKRAGRGRTAGGPEAD